MYYNILFHFIIILALFYLQKMEQIDVINSLLVHLLIHKDPFCGQYTFNPDPHTTLTLGL